MSDQTAQSDRPSPAGSISRRGVLRAAGAGAAIMGAGGLLQACSSSIKGAGSGSGGTKAITIGWIHPLTGALAGFGAPDNWVISKIKQTTPYKNGFKIGGKTYAVTIKSYDTQSSPTRAGDLARTAILSDGVNLLLASSTPETVNAVASQAESLHTPLICSNIPWESWYINLGGNPLKPTLKPKYVVMYFLGAEHLAKCFIPMWNRIHPSSTPTRSSPPRSRTTRTATRSARCSRPSPRGRATRSTCPRPTPTGPRTTPR
jgi:branched-chain amino acid transport system substrate-binding protein